MECMYKINKVYCNEKIQDLCGLSYPGHKYGCPNFNVGKLECPYTVPLIDKVIDITKPMYLIGIDFDLKAHRLKMKVRHPNWTERQCGNVLYWQPHHKKQLKEMILKNIGKNTFYTLKPEAYGINMNLTLRQIGIKLNWNYPLKKVWRIAFIGNLK